MAVNTMTEQEHARIAEAIRKAEDQHGGRDLLRRGAGERQLFLFGGLIVTVSIMIVSLAVAFALEDWWFGIRVPVFVAAQLLALAAALALLYAFPWLRMRLVPRRWQYIRAHDNALKQFLARNVHLTAERTGVLIFVSLAERYAEIVADAGINAKVPQETWDGVVAELIEHARNDRLADGFVSAVETVGKLLATHFPVEPGDMNELDDHLVEI